MARKLDPKEQELAARGCFSVVDAASYKPANFVITTNSRRVGKIIGERTVNRRGGWRTKAGREHVFEVREWFPAAKRWAKTPTQVRSSDAEFASLDDLKKAKLVKIDKRTGIWCPKKP